MMYHPDFLYLPNHVIIPFNLGLPVLYVTPLDSFEPISCSPTLVVYYSSL